MNESKKAISRIEIPEDSDDMKVREKVLLSGIIVGILMISGILTTIMSFVSSISQSTKILAIIVSVFFIVVAFLIAKRAL